MDAATDVLMIWQYFLFKLAIDKLFKIICNISVNLFINILETKFSDNAKVNKT